MFESHSPQHHHNDKSDIQTYRNVNPLVMNKNHTINLSTHGHGTYEHVQIFTYIQVLIIETKKHKLKHN